MATDLALELSGYVNGAAVEVSGRGRVEARKAGWRLELRLDAQRIPLHWDIVLVALELLHAPLLVGVVGEGEDASPILLRSRSLLLDEHGREAGTWDESAVVEQVEGRLRWRVQILRCDVRFEHLERVTALETPCQIRAIPMGEGWAVTTATWAFSTGHGNGYQGVITTAVDRQFEAGGEALTAQSFKLAREPMQDGGEKLSIDVGFLTTHEKRRARPA